jgi:hypothetical protein
MTGIVTIESEVPFGKLLYTHLYLHDLELDKLAPHGQMERHYLAWETVRKQSNPYFQTGTGFEGYLVGRCPDSEAALEEILNINQSILDAIARMYHYQYGFQTRLMQTLQKERSDPKYIHIWSAYLGAELGKLRARILRDDKAQLFRMQTYKTVKNLPPMIYHKDAEDITQNYAIGVGDCPQESKLAVNLQMLKSSQQNAWVVAVNIGEFGHPLLRKVVERAAS